MKFINESHETFYNERLNVIRKDDVYYRALFYILGICEITREHYNEIFDFEKKTINLASLQKGWQTGTSKKVTRLALNLWNSSLMYEDEEDLNNEKLSEYYTVSEVFCCSYAPYFYEGIKIRYPEYTNEQVKKY